MASDGDRDGTEALRLQNVVERERAKLRALQDISSALGSTLDLGELLDMILDRISELMEADRSTLYLLDDRRSTCSTRRPTSSGPRWPRGMRSMRFV